MNDMETQSPTPQSQSGMNMMMAVGAIVVLGIIGFFIVRSTAQEPAQDAASTDVRVNATDDVVNDTMMTPEQSAAADTAADTPHTETMDGDVRVISVEGGAFYYKPNEIRVKKGDKVRIVMASKGDEGMMHDFTIDELDVAMPVVPTGETGTVEFVADTVGEFEFYCSVGEHRANGQVGTLIVEE